MSLNITHFGHSTNQREFIHQFIDLCRRYDNFGGSDFAQTVTPSDDGHSVTVETAHANGTSHNLVYDLADCLTQADVHQIADQAFDDTYAESAR